MNMTLKAHCWIL